MAQWRFARAKTKAKGYIAFITVLVISAITVVIATTLLIISTDNATAVAEITNSIQARALADTCVEVAINKLKLNTAYTGNETVTVGTTGSCQILTITGSGNSNRVIQATSTLNNTTRKVVVTLTTVNPTTMISSWQEVADFS